MVIKDTETNLIVSLLAKVMTSPTTTASKNPTTKLKPIYCSDFSP